jgi:O-antigen/teichoic acid export membrane protein
MSRTQRFFYNSLSTAFYQVCIMIAGLVMPRIMLKYYGSEINGLVSSINQFIVYFNLVEAGLSSAAIYALYKPLADNDHKAINGVVAAAKKFYTQSGYIFVSLTIGLAIFYPLFIDIDILSPISVVLLVLILGTNGALEFFTLSKYRVLLTADQRTYVISLASLVHIITSTIIVIIFGTMRIDIVLLRLIALSSIFLRSLILMVYTKINYKYVDYKVSPNTKALNKRWDALYLQIMGAIHTGAPIIILTIVTRDLKLVSVYSIFNMVIVGLNGLLSIFKSGLPASFGDVITRGETKTLQRSYSEFELLYYALITVIYSVAFVTIMPFIRIYTSGVTDVDYNLPLVGFLFVLSGLLYNLKTPQGMLVISAGMFRETRAQVTIQGLITVVLGFIMTPFIGIYGVLIASILSDIYRSIDLLIFIPRKLTKLPVKLTVKRILMILVSTVIILLPFYQIRLNPSNYIEWGLYACIIGLYSCAVVFIVSFLFDRDTFKGITRRLKGMVRK